MFQLDINVERIIKDVIIKSEYIISNNINSPVDMKTINISERPNAKISINVVLGYEKVYPRMLPKIN